MANDIGYYQQALLNSNPDLAALKAKLGMKADTGMAPTSDAANGDIMDALMESYKKNFYKQTKPSLNKRLGEIGTGLQGVNYGRNTGLGVMGNAAGGFMKAMEGDTTDNAATPADIKTLSEIQKNMADAHKAGREASGKGSETLTEDFTYTEPLTGLKYVLPKGMPINEARVQIDANKIPVAYDPTMGQFAPGYSDQFPGIAERRNEALRKKVLLDAAKNAGNQTSSDPKKVIRARK
jgi:hypothetical protein